MISMVGNGARSIRIGLATALLAFWVAGCSGTKPQADNGNGASSMSGVQTASLQQQPIARYTGEPSKTLSFVYTAKKELSLTFDGLGDRETIERLLDELDKHHIKATFFVPGMRAAEEPDLVKELASRGHEVENNTLTRADLTTLSYEEIYKEINRTNGLIADATGKQPQFVGPGGPYERRRSPGGGANRTKGRRFLQHQSEGQRHAKRQGNRRLHTEVH
ncbi:hypothetical protein HMSSN036_38190 [Paenibacillus macerans]|nr:hypothetical protein HMSSN036_38190 [Paenibacillus macerans]